MLRHFLKLAGVGLFLAFLITDFARAEPSAADKRKIVARTISKRNLLALPSFSAQVQSNRSKSTSTRRARNQALLPPVLSSIAASPIKDLFWREINGVNVVDAINSSSADQNHCNEFYSGQQDGQSGGLGACHLAESVGYTYSNILQSGTSLCYMKNFPSQKNLVAGAITVTSGALPTGGIQNLFSPPSGALDRLVQVVPTGEEDQEGGDEDRRSKEGKGNIFLQVGSQEKNKAADNLYSVVIWFCHEGESEVSGYNKVSISKALRLYSEYGADDEFGKSFSSVEGFLSARGNSVVWDPSKTRRSSTVVSDEGGGQFKAEVEITANNLIKVKRVDNFSGSMGKGYIITKYSGSKASDLRFLSGAFMDNHGGESFTEATQYKNSFYAVDTDSPLLGPVQNEDLNSEFYTSGFDLDIDTSPYSCDATPDITVSLDFSVATLRESIRECETEQLGNMHFCHDDPEVRQADENYGEVCRGGP